MRNVPSSNSAGFRHDLVARACLVLICEARQGIRPWRTVRLEDLSPQGFRVAWFPDVNIDMPLRLRIPGMQLLSAEIRLRTNATICCAFSEPLHIAVFEHLLKQADLFR